MDHTDEKKLQENYPFTRGKYFEEYNAILGYYQGRSCIENSRGKTALDIPCGDGFITEIFSRHFDKVMGVDASGAHLESARKRIPNVEFHKSLIEELSLEEKFDSVFLIKGGSRLAPPVI